jgi:hypothetical protein
MTNERQYLCSLIDSDHDEETAIYAATRSKARYRYWLEVRECLPDVKLTQINARAGEPPRPDAREWERLGITDRQRNLARHALGFDGRNRESHRNNYVVGPGGDGHQEWLDLANKRLAYRREAPAGYGGADIFRCSKKLALAVRGPYDHLGYGWGTSDYDDSPRP